MAKKNNSPKSLKEQLAPLKAQMKAEEAKPKEEKKKEPPKPAPRPEPMPAAKPAAKAPTTPQAPQSDAPSDAEMVEFWRAAGGAVPISESGREVHEPKKKKSAPSEPQPASSKPSTLDQETFRDLLDLSDNTLQHALYEKEGVQQTPQRAISSKRVELMGLSEAAAKERLLRFLKAAKGRGERVVLVVFGKEPTLKAVVEELLEKNRGTLVLHVSDAGEPMAFKVTLA